MAGGNSDEKLQTLTESQRFGLRIAGVVSLLFIAAIALMVIPENGILRDPINHTVMPSPFIKGIVPLIILFFLCRLAGLWHRYPHNSTSGGFTAFND